MKKANEIKRSHGIMALTKLSGYDSVHGRESARVAMSNTRPTADTVQRGLHNAGEQYRPV
jgi:hypothetical protein